jgi:Cu(I)/Ag(I) efflux system membrane fusion protein
MNRISVAALVLSAALVGLAFAIVFVWPDRLQTRSYGGVATAPATEQGSRRVLYYRNPMGAPDVSPTPKKDSMGMDYIAVYADENTGPKGTVRLSPEKIQRAGIRTMAVRRERLSQPTRAVATIVADEKRVSVLTAKFDGFVEELAVAQTGVTVRKGQPLARVWISSQEILQKQSDLVLAARGGSDLERAAANLRLFGISDEVISEIRRTGVPVRSIVINAQSAGTVMEKPAVPGMRFEAGATLFKLIDLSAVWLIAQVAERDLRGIKPGQQATISLNAEPGGELTGRVAFIYPELDQKTRTGSVRIEVDNADGRFRIGQYADVTIDVSISDETVISVPASAVIDSGIRRVAFVAKDNGTFEPRNVVLGRRGGGMVEIKEGLSEGERIVVTGNFLLDAESNLRSALSGLEPVEQNK